MRRLVKALSGSALLTIATLSVPGAALAAQNHAMAPPAKDNPIKGTVHSDRTWTPEKRDTSRHKTDNLDGNVVLTLRNTVDGELCVRLHNSRSDVAFSNPVCWAAGEYDRKPLATGVRPGTEFIVEAKKSGYGDNNDWGGQIRY